jgi:hypothetical protein
VASGGTATLGLNSTRDYAADSGLLNLTIWDGTEMKRMMMADVDVSTAQGNDAWMLLIPAPCRARWFS